ncbi:hypothetical protein [Methylobacterium sp. JK268]
MSQPRPLTLRAEAIVARARRLAEDHHVVLAAVRAALQEGAPAEPARKRMPERI